MSTVIRCIFTIIVLFQDSPLHFREIIAIQRMGRDALLSLSLYRYQIEAKELNDCTSKKNNDESATTFSYDRTPV